MSLETIKEDVLAAYKAAVAGIHAQFANTLAQAGHAVNETNSSSQLINSAAAAANSLGKPAGANAAPNYADFALNAYMNSMGNAASQFAAAHLPDQYKPLIEEMDAGVLALMGLKPISKTEVVEGVTKAVETAAAIAEPAAAPVIAVAAPIIEQVETSLLQPKAPAPASESEPVAEPETLAPASVDKAGLLGDDKA